MIGRLWSEQHPVRELLRARRASRSLPGNRRDPYKVGLAIEGGGLRGVVSAGMLVALDELGYADTFDDVYASSAGAVNAAYFIPRKTWFPLSIYFDDLTSPRFLNFRRALRGRSLMDLDFVFDDVMTRRKPLDFQSIIDDPVRLHVMVTDVDRLAALDVCRFDSPEDLRAAVRASAWLPVAAKGTARFRGRRAIDGAVLQFHPFRAALLDGCTHILSLSTRPITPPATALSPSTYLVAGYLESMRRGLGSGMIAALRQYLSEDKPRLIRNRLAPENSLAILDLAPLPGTREVKRHETRSGMLINGARDGYRLVHLVLEGEDVVVAPRLTVYRPDPPQTADGVDA